MNGKPVVYQDMNNYSVIAAYKLAYAKHNKCYKIKSLVQY